MIEAYARTFVCDGFYEQFDPASHVWPGLEAAKNITVGIQSEWQHWSAWSSIGTPSFKLLSTFCDNRDKTFIKCEEGYIGIAPPATLPGDQVCVLLGCNALMVLRPIGSGNYLVVGECFVHGLSEGEALLGPLRKNVRAVRVLDKAVGLLEAFVGETTDDVPFLDPRIEALNLSSEELEIYKQRLSRHGNSRLHISSESLRSMGVGVRYFDLV
jgi:hypothetical protein